jgi:hypothetical protein
VRDKRIYIQFPVGQTIPWSLAGGTQEIEQRFRKLVPSEQEKFA